MKKACEYIPEFLCHSTIEEAIKQAQREAILEVGIKCASKVQVPYLQTGMTNLAARAQKACIDVMNRQIKEL